jgi:Glycosyl transferase family 2
MPRITIAVPVFNGATLLSEGLADLQRQTHRDFEAVVFDNGSSDQTNAIAQGFADADKRFSVVRRPAVVPAIENFAAALDACDCEYFAWRAYDDLSAPNFIETLSRCLDDAPAKDLAVGAIHTLKPHKSEHPSIRALPRLPESRLGAALMLMERAPASWFYGLHRRSRLLKEFPRAAAVLPQAWATDHLTLFPYLLDGSIVISNQTYFVQRIIKQAGNTDWSLPTVKAQWDVRRRFHGYCAERLAETDISAMSQLAIRAALPRYTSARTFRVSKMLGKALSGR